MPEYSPQPVACKLGGEALEAAKRLIALEREILNERTGGRYPAGIHAELTRRDVMHEIRKKAPELLEQLGLDRPAIQIEQEEGGYPRAYKVFPYLAECVGMDETTVFLFTHVDYKGNLHTPVGGERIPADDLKATDFGELVYQRRGSIGYPSVMAPKEGTSLPAGFDPETHMFERKGFEGRRSKVFIAAGSSLACVQDYLRRRDDLEAAKKEVRETLEELAPDLQGSVLGADKGDRLRITCFFKTGENRKTETWLRVANEDRAGAPVVPRDNEYFTADDYANGAFRVQPNRNTEAGRKLGRLFDRLLSEPDLGQYWQIHNPTASGLKDKFQAGSHPELGNRVPKLDTIRGVHYLVYTLDNDATKDHCNPPGSIPVKLAEYLWLKADMRDEENFVRLPEPPAPLSHMRPVKPEPKP